MQVSRASEANDKIQVIKYLEVGDITITGSGDVSDAAFYAAKEIILTITAKRPEIRSGLSGYECILLAPGESVAAALGWDKDQTGSTGAALVQQERLGFPGRFASTIQKRNRPNMDTFVHEFGHAIHYVISKIDPEFERSLNQSYNQAMRLGLWADKYFSQDNWKLEQSPIWEYWAEGVRMWYYVGKGQEFETTDAFKKYDPGLTSVLGLWLSEAEIPRRY